MTGESYDDLIIELLQKRPGVAAELFNVAIKENTPEELAIILRQISAAGYRVSLTPEPTPRKRAKTSATAAAKAEKRLSASRGRTRHSAAAIA